MERFVTDVYFTDLIFEEVAKNGGSGSGNFGHAGREGLIGGSGAGATNLASEFASKILKAKADAKAKLDAFDKANPNVSQYDVDRGELVRNTRDVAFAMSKSLKDEYSEDFSIDPDSPTGLEDLDENDLYTLKTMVGEHYYSPLNLSGEKNAVKTLAVLEYYRRHPDQIKEDLNSYGDDWSKAQIDSVVSRHNAMTKDIGLWNKKTTAEKGEFQSQQQFLFERNMRRVGKVLRDGKGTKLPKDWAHDYRDAIDSLGINSQTNNALRRMTFGVELADKPVTSTEYSNMLNDYYKKVSLDALNTGKMQKIIDSGQGKVTVYRYGAIDGSRKQANGVFFTASKTYASMYSDRAWDSAGNTDTSMFKSYDLNVSGLKIKSAKSTETLYEELFDKPLFKPGKTYVDDGRVNTLWTGERKVHRELQKEGYQLVNYEDAPMDNGLGDIFEGAGIGTSGASEVVVLDKTLLKDLASQGVTVK